MKLQVNSQEKVYLTSGNKALKAKEKCGMSIGDFIGNIDSNNTLQRVTSEIVVDFSGIEDLGNYALSNKFQGNTNISSISFPDLTTISGLYALNYMCQGNINLTTISFPELTSISGQYAFSFAFNNSRIMSVTFPKLTTITGLNAFNNAFNNNTQTLTSISFPELTSISAAYAFTSAFSSNNYLTSVSFPKLATITGNSVFSSFISFCTALTDIEFPELTSISAIYNGAVFASTFQSDTSLRTVRFPKLSTIEITGGSTSGGSFTSCYNNCSVLTDIYFNALKTTSFVGSTWQFSSMFNSTSMSRSGNCTMHFPSNLESTIQGLTGYPNFGATAGRVTLAYDLTATE